MWLLGQLHSAGNRTGIVSQQRADEVLLLLDTALQVGDGFGCHGDQLFRLANVELGAGSAICQRSGKLQRLLPRGQRPFCDLKLKVVGAQLEIRGGDITHQRTHDLPARPFCSQQIGACCFRGAAILAPEVEIPRHGGIHRVRACFVLWRQIFLSRTALVGA